jgi:hypothetical protein
MIYSRLIGAVAAEEQLENLRKSSLDYVRDDELLAEAIN